MERGSVEGEVFHRGAVAVLTPDPVRSDVESHLTTLVRKELIRSTAPTFPDDEGFRFRHLLIRDAAYESLPKSVRAELHERFATWLEEHGTELVELDEILGYHLEQACGYRAELGMPDDPMLAAAARRRLTAAGRRADLRQDHGAAVSLLERAAALVPPAEIDLALETELGDALFWAGKGVDAVQRADFLAERASAAGDRVGELCGRVKASLFRTFLEPEGETEKLAALLALALPVFQAAADDVALSIGYAALGQVANMRAQMDAGLEACERAAAHARQAGLPHEFVGWRAAFRFFGTTPVSELLVWLDENEPREGRGHSHRVYRAGALAMLGRFDEARAILAETRAELAERGGGIRLANTTGQDSVDVELWAADPAAAAELGAEGCRLYEELGEKSFLSTAAGKLAQALYALDRLEEADVWAGRTAELGSSDDAMTQMLWRQVRAKVLARRGQHAEAERLAREAVAIGEETDMLDAQGNAYADLAEVLQLAGQADEAAAALEQALERYERKGNIVSTQRARTRLAEIRAAVL
jgi:tetratricopeptide (TPR) repeat protein